MASWANGRGMAIGAWQSNKNQQLGKSTYVQAMHLSEGISMQYHNSDNNITSHVYKTFHSILPNSGRVAS